MDSILIAKTRKALGKQVKSLRKNKLLPAVLYGHGVKNVALTLEYALFDKLYRQVGESSLVDLKIDDKHPVKVLIQDIQVHPVNGKYIHVDFHQVKMTEKITTEVALEFVGESKAVKEQGAILVKSLDKVKIECLPKDLIKSIKVDISFLKEFNDIIRVSDLKTPAGIEIKDKPEEVVVLAQPPRTEEELKELEEKPEEVVEKVEEVEEKEKETEGEEKAAEEISKDQKQAAIESTYSYYIIKFL
jgi:large subunit ribosomal protein L25